MAAAKEMGVAASGIVGVVETLRQKLGSLDAEIAADATGLAEFEKQIRCLESRKQDLLKRLEANEAWAADYDANIAPFQSTYAKNTASIKAQYDKCRAFHGKGVAMLERDFGYHPAFKRPTDDFSAVPFRPRKLA
mmetsp:Transcript_28623/g.92151  ORF Transcript_28623/g.92151 Transcript_28623/m.92151 type:complete len:135 (+) Transcript_28623:19-423(+)